jgi:NADH dehydrogenase
VLGPFAPRLRKYTAKQLRERGVELRLGVAVKEVHDDCVVLSDRERLPSAATIWATGVRRWMTRSPAGGSRRDAAAA